MLMKREIGFAEKKQTRGRKLKSTILTEQIPKLIHQMKTSYYTNGWVCDCQTDHNI